MNELLSKDFLASIGVTLDEQMYRALKAHLEDTLDQRVIEEIIEELDERQLGELSGLRSGPSEILQHWLVSNVPQLNEIVQGEIAILLGDIVERADEL
jgi:hypothetical protein